MAQPTAGDSLITIVLRVLESLTIFLFILTFLALGMYAIGTSQEFLASTQLLLLTLLRAGAGAAALAGLHYTAVAVVWSRERHHTLYGRILFGGITVLVGTAIWLSVELLVVFLTPYP